MGRQITPRKRAFARHYAETQDVQTAARLAGYSSHQGCYRFIKRDERGEYVDEVMAAMLEEYGSDDYVEPTPTQLVKEKVPAAVISMLTRRPTTPVDTDEPLTLASILQTMAEVSRDDSFPAGPRVQVLMFLVKHLQSEQAETVQPDEQVLAEVKTMLGILE
jgi:hypothetical protein